MTSTDVTDSIEQDIKDGVQNVSVDGMNVNVMDPLRRLETLQKLENRQAARRGGLPFGFTKVISKGLE